MYVIDNERFVLYKDYPSLPDKYIVYARFSKKKQSYILVTIPKKSSTALVKTTDVGKLTPIVTDVLLKSKYLSFTHDIQPILPWVAFHFSEKNPVILQTLIHDSYIENNELFISSLWCWKHFFNDIFHHLTLQFVNDEICVELKEWVDKTPVLKNKYKDNWIDLFEDIDGPGVLDVEIIENDIYVKVLYIVQYTCQ
tara:strand:- start:5806 stop:6393 length:588 start_codon:yes stop_codon:yes gene_type:complete